MKAKLLMILLISLSLIVAGCVDNTESTTEENASTNNSVTDTANNNTVTNNTDNTDNTSTGETSSVNTSSEENGNGGVQVIEYEGPKTYTLYMENYLIQPNNLTISQHDTVVWFNRNNPTRLFTLVSDDGLWENTTIGYRLSFKYTFNETGTYTYHVLGWEERMKGTIIVK
ncbi:Plastocyanin [Methanolobus vulcani]|jgi:hypothetical protein|uniref:Plastocyanin n=1 Tax=Methanolobus vulcani TaxID=38026 RepID=A0A7Z7B2K2_9EURY|nr:hypothetical protein [Methanolobus vulcani]MDK2947739.1 hypothetical protein [Methanolobus sp.]SDG03374.1 Plastocyanin [Methanolobus vulcani]